MKKIFFLACLLLSALMTFAQTKKVAILEVVDREGKLSYGNKMMLRSNLARAITNTVGYEAYDRTDMDAIMSEHDFQRTGLVSEDQIKQLGKMTGVELILVAEAALVGNNSMFVSAKILNVETAKVEMMDNITMSLESMAMQQGCTTLANRLFGASSGGNANNNMQQRRNQYTPMSNKEYEWFLFNNCPEAYSLHKSGKQMITAGWILSGTGLAMIIGGGVMTAISEYNYTSYDYYDDYYDYYYRHDRDKYTKNVIREGGITMIVIGAVVGGVGGGTLLGIGYKRRNKAYDIYNTKCSSSSAPITFNLTAGRNGLGIAMNF